MVVLPSSLSDHPSLLGIVRMPKCTYTTNPVKVPILQYADATKKWVAHTQTMTLAETITSGTSTSVSYSVSKNNTTDFYPYTYYLLTDGECEPLLLHPQYLPSSFTIKGKYALSHQPIERYYPSSYKGSTDGVIYNITNNNQMMLPTGTNEGLQYMSANANTIAQTKATNYDNHTLNTIATPLSAVGLSSVLNLGSVVSSYISNDTNIVNAIKTANARQKDILLTPSSISSWGTVSTRNAFGTDCVRLIKYTVRDVVKTKINNFVERYGNKYNSYATINHKTYKGYIKMIGPDIDSGIDNIYISQIKNILERGIYIE